MQKQKPAHVIRFGSIKATIWANESPNGTWYNVQVCRIYKNANDWKESNSLARDDLPLACKALDQAHTWIYEQAKPPRNRQETQDSPTAETVNASDAGAARPM